MRTRGRSDLSDAKAIHVFVGDITAGGERIDVLCNNAGINRRGALLDLTVEDCEISFTVNLNAMSHMCRRCCHTATGISTTPNTGRLT